MFGALLVLTIAFLPVFALQGEEGRLFRPLALAKTFSMAVRLGARGHAGARADGHVPEGQDPPGGEEPHQPALHRGVSPDPAALPASGDGSSSRLVLVIA
jgi:Cu(I)/Ag(I) efflux system membrane protein CusA/SilA